MTPDHRADEFSAQAEGPGWAVDISRWGARMTIHSRASRIAAEVVTFEGHVWLQVRRDGAGPLNGPELSIFSADREWLQRVADAINSLPPLPPPFQPPEPVPEAPDEMPF